MAKSPQTAPTASYRVLRPLRHDGETYAPGDEVDLTALQAAQLVKLAVVVAEPQAGAAAPAKTP